MKMLKIADLSVKLGNFELTGVNFEVARGEYFVLLGMSGAGKSVLLEVIGGLIRVDKGGVILDGRDITREKIQRRGVGLVFQDAALFPHMSVFNNIAYPLKCQGYKGNIIKKRITELAGITSVSHILKRTPRHLSGGEMQRVALARALALEPEVLLLDEPLSSLDVQLRTGMRSLLREINRRGQTIIHVTHDYEEAALLAQKIGVIENGTVVQTGSSEEGFQHPKSEFVAHFVGIRNFFSGSLREGSGTLRYFVTGSLELTLLSDEPPGEGFVVIRAEDIILSSARQSSSAVNNFRGIIAGLVPARLGTEVMVDIGVTLGVLVSDESVAAMQLHAGKTVWLSFKASALRFIRR